MGFADGDDWVDLDFYEKLYSKAKEADSDIVKSETKIYEQNHSIRLSNTSNLIRKNKKKVYFTCEFWSGIYKRDLILKNHILFPENCITSEDTAFLNHCIIKCKKLSLVEDTYYHYIRHNDSLDSSYLNLEKINSTLIAINLIVSNLNNATEYELSKDEYLYAYSFYFLFLFNALFRNDDLNCKSECIKNIIKIFNICKDQSGLKSYIQMKLPCVYQCIIDNNVEKFLDIVLSCKNYIEFTTKNIRANICRKI